MDEDARDRAPGQAIQSGRCLTGRGAGRSKGAPYDFASSSLAVGRGWPPGARDRLIGEFRTLLVRTYSNALTQYRDQQIDFKPLRGKAGDTDVTVRTECVSRAPAPVEIDYAREAGRELEDLDVIVAGVSLVTASPKLVCLRNPQRWHRRP
ncbi:MAG: ABC transporter substrate-binding protein [Rhodocyclaceae bacterium]